MLISPHTTALGHRQPKPRRHRALLALCLSGLLVTGCSYSYTAEDGARRMIGFVDITIRPAEDAPNIAGQVIDLQSVGLSYNQTAAGQNVTLGYSHEKVGFLRNNALVLGNPIAIDRPRQSHGE